MKLKNLLYGILITILFISTIQCCSKKKMVVEEAQVEMSIPDSDADGVIDYQDVGYDEIAIESGKVLELEKSIITSPTMSIERKIGSIITDSITVQKYELGRIVYDIPKKMEKLKTYTIQVNIARDTMDIKIYDGMTITVDTIIRTSKVMQVEIIDPTGDFFKIISKNEKQFIEIDEHTTWLFYVTPLKSGISQLVLLVSIMKDGNIKQTTYRDSVEIKTTPTLEIKLWIQNYWQWAFGIFVLPLIAYIKKKFFTKKTS